MFFALIALNVVLGALAARWGAQGYTPYSIMATIGAVAVVFFGVAVFALIASPFPLIFSAIGGCVIGFISLSWKTRRV